MRRIASVFVLGCASLALGLAGPVWAQATGPADQQGQGQDDSAKAKRDQEWGSKAPTLPQLRNAGPCPFVKVLYDAARVVDFQGARQASAAVTYTGEIENLSASCAYKSNEPIQVGMRVLFSFGRGPAATSNRRDYRYWVAVTDRNRGVLAKEYFDVPVTFPAGQDRVSVTQDVSGIVIPRASIQVSGSNFEVLTGFDVTPEQADFNRQGKRFRVNAGAPVAAQASPPAQP
ncbi:MAG: Tat pathway signal sequence domain protein [Caulobacterales bacterium]